MKLNKLKGQTKQELERNLATLTEKQLKVLKEEADYYLLVYPQGTGDDELEDLLNLLTEMWYPD